MSWIIYMTETRGTLVTRIWASLGWLEEEQFSQAKDRHCFLEQFIACCQDCSQSAACLARLVWRLVHMGRDAGSGELTTQRFWPTTPSLLWRSSRAVTGKTDPCRLNSNPHLWIEAIKKALLDVSCELCGSMIASVSHGWVGDLWPRLAKAGESRVFTSSPMEPVLHQPALIICQWDGYFFNTATCIVKNAILVPLKAMSIDDIY